jgi:hypothetical protein
MARARFQTSLSSRQGLFASGATRVLGRWDRLPEALARLLEPASNLLASRPTFGSLGRTLAIRAATRGWLAQLSPPPPAPPQPPEQPGH